MPFNACILMNWWYVQYSTTASNQCEGMHCDEEGVCLDEITLHAYCEWQNCTRWVCFLGLRPASFSLVKHPSRWTVMKAKARRSKLRDNTSISRWRARYVTLRRVVNRESQRPLLWGSIQTLIAMHLMASWMATLTGTHTRQSWSIFDLRISLKAYRWCICVLFHQSTVLSSR